MSASVLHDRGHHSSLHVERSSSPLRGPLAGPSGMRRRTCRQQTVGNSASGREGARFGREGATLVAKEQALATSGPKSLKVGMHKGLFDAVYHSRTNCSPLS